MQQDNRQVIKLLESQFIKICEKSLLHQSEQLRKLLVKAINDCPTKQCFEQKIVYLREIDRNYNGLWQFVGNQIQECISRQYSTQGILGYRKCYLMFQKVIQWETKEKLIQDPSVEKGILGAIRSKLQKEQGKKQQIF